METAVFEEKVLNMLSNLQKEISVMKREIKYIKELISEEYLTEEEEQILEDALKHEKEGKLIPLDEIKRQLGI